MTKSQGERSKQGKSVFCVVHASRPSAVPEAQAEAAGHWRRR
ncbi:hypothetical protein AB0B52_32905 [Streptomyces griseofuscus]